MVKISFQNQLGKALKAARKERRLTQITLSEKAGISVPTLRLLENGKGRTSSWNAVLDVLNLELRGRSLPQVLMRDRTF